MFRRVTEREVINQNTKNQLSLPVLLVYVLYKGSAAVFGLEELKAAR